MRRRAFITLLGGAATSWPFAVRAQQSTAMRQVGMIAGGADDDANTRERIAAFRQALDALGWSEGRNIHIEYRYSEGKPERFPQFAREMVALRPDVIFAWTTPAVKALQEVTHTIPIIFINVSDPIGSGIVPSLARPGSNVSGIMLYEEGITSKWLGMLKEIAPNLERVALVANPRSTPYDYFLRSAKARAPSLGVELVPMQINDPGEYKRNIEGFAQQPHGGLVFLPDSFSILNHDLVITLAAEYRLPAVYPLRFFVTAGGLMSYDTDVLEQNRQAASYVDRILRGATPADLPVQAPTKYETVLNLKTAKALGVTVPPTLLVRADEVIE